MEVIKTPIEGLEIIEQRKFADSRGYFTETYNQKLFKEKGLDIQFVQDNLSVSKKNVIRGLHFQNPPFAQGKLVRVLKGSAIDVAVDIRKSSPTYGKHFSVLLSAENNRSLWIPEGFAHGFSSLEDETVFYYKCTNFYNPQTEQSIRWNDPVLAINWRVQNPVVSEKDAMANIFNELKSLF
jgi:dTDP-4-dehydrorhamnose 3,5-epimerase